MKNNIRRFHFASIAAALLLMLSPAYAADTVVIIPLGGAKNYMYWQGDWAVDTAYKVGDAVHMDGSSYMCTTAHTSTDTDYPPADLGAYWSLIAAKGADGTTESETDPTVDASVKDGVTWDEVGSKPAGFADGIDDDSGGDIQSVGAGTGLTGGGLTGDVTLDVNPTAIQTRVSGSCPAGESIRVIAEDGTVTCEADNDSGGDITSVGTSNGISGGATTGDVSLTADTTYLQRRVSSSCSAGSSIRAIAVDGTVTCETDDDSGGDITGVTAGTGLTGGGTANDVSLSIAVPLSLSGNALEEGIVKGTNSNAEGYGVFGSVSSTATGISFGGYFSSDTTAGRGVHGLASGINGYGVYGLATNTGTVTNVGGWFGALGQSGRGVIATSSGATGYGVYSLTTGDSSKAVYGEAQSTTGTTYGGYFTSASSAGTGVFATAGGTSGKAVHGHVSSTTGTTYGGYFTSASADGVGVYGEGTDTGTGITYGGQFISASDNGMGVLGLSSNSGDVSNFGGYFQAEGTYGIGSSSIANGQNGIGAAGSASGTSGRGVVGDAISTTGTTFGGYFTSASADGVGVYGEVTDTGTGTTYGGQFISASNNGMGVVGLSSNSGDVSNFGGYFQAEGTYGIGSSSIANGQNGIGAAGSATGTSGRGVVGDATSTTGTTYGGYFTSASSAGYAVYGETSSATGTTYGGYFKSPSDSGRAVMGYASYTGSGTTYGGYFSSASVGGIGVAGVAVAQGTGVRALANTGTAVYATANSGVGVMAESYSVDGKGLWASAPGASSTGVYSSGTLYDFYAAGAGTNYSPFTGAHEVRLTEDAPAAIKPGMIVSSTGKAETRTKENGEISLSSTLPTVAVSSTEMDKAIFGVLVSETPLPKDHWYQAADGERFAVINALGEGRMWVCELNGSIEAGDFITSSNLPGYGQRQDDDLLHSYTVAKAIETVDWNTVTETVDYNGQPVKVYLVAVTYTSG